MLVIWENFSGFARVPNWLSIRRSNKKGTLMHKSQSLPVKCFLGFFCIAIAIVMAVPTCSMAANDDFGKPSRELRTASRMIYKFMQRHLSNRQINDEIATRAMELYLKGLDPMKMYFMQSDVDEFSMVADEIDENLRDGRFTIAFQVFERFMERVGQRVNLANEILESDLDFTLDEDLVTDRDEITFATSIDEMRSRWRKRIKYNILLYENDEKTTGKDPVERVRKRYQSYYNRLKNYGNEDVAEIYISSITTSFDPHTSYMSEATYESFMINMNLELEGIGATLQSTDDGLTVIRRIVPDGAADKQSDLAVEDKIVAVGQVTGEMVDITDMKLDDVVDMIRGKAGTIVKLAILSPGSNEIKTITITRERIELKDSAAQGTVFEAGLKDDGSKYQIGVIDLPSFYTDMSGRGGSVGRSTTRDMRNILDDFSTTGVDAVVVDLRRNGGGSLREAIDCTGLFIDRGPVVQVRDFLGNQEVLNDSARGVAWNGPLVVVTSKFSASASEILAGAVQDYERGLVVGDTATHGKGTVQTLVNLGEELLGLPADDNSLGALKLTIQQFYRPNGDSTQVRGVLSDLTLPSLTDHLDVGEGDLDYPVDFHQIAKASYNVVGQISSPVIEALKAKSVERVAESEDFQRVASQIEKYIEQKEAKKISLNREKFNARTKEFDNEKANKDLIDEQMNSGDIVRDYYMEEVLSITSDYVKALKDKLAQRR